ncbi:MAG: hypothetical protein ACRDBY_01055 [Cetobacterium sp.]
MKNRLLTVEEIGIFGANKQKGLFIEYNSSTYGLIQLEYYKGSNDGKYYYLITNNNVSYYNNGESHKDVMVIHSKIEKLIDVILDGCTYEEFDKKYNSLFNFKKYYDDTFDTYKLYNFIKENEKELKEWIEKIYPIF